MRVMKIFFRHAMILFAAFGFVASHAQTSNPVKKNEASKNAAQKRPIEPALAPHEISIAEKVHVGRMPCELGTSVHMTADQHAPGYFNLQGQGYKYRMRPVTTSTGAIRLEDEKAGAVWLQLANKSMLMDQKKGRRLADECAHPDQVAVAKEMKINPPPALIDVSNGASPNQR
jgi:hypothetical protein